MPADKSVGASLVLTFLFGPFGLLYTSVIGGVVMVFVWLVVAVVTQGIGVLVLWPLTMVWGAVSASNQHAEHQRWPAMQRLPPPGLLAYDPRPGYRRPPPPPPPVPPPPDQPWA
jgi:hypothetical protein